MTDIKAEHRSGNRCIRLVHGDITTERVDAIVNAANAGLQHGGGLAGAISHSGGPVIQQESDSWVQIHGQVEHARPALTSAGKLACRYIIHAVGPVWESGNEDQKLADTIHGVLTCATDKQFETISIPAISTGIFRFPKLRAARIILKEIGTWFQAHPQSSLREIRVTIIDAATLQPFTQAFMELWPGSKTES